MSCVRSCCWTVRAGAKSTLPRDNVARSHSFCAVRLFFRWLIAFDAKHVIIFLYIFIIIRPIFIMSEGFYAQTTIPFGLHHRAYRILRMNARFASLSLSFTLSSTRLYVVCLFWLSPASPHAIPCFPLLCCFCFHFSLSPAHLLLPLEIPHSLIYRRLLQHHEKMKSSKSGAKQVEQKAASPNWHCYKIVSHDFEEKKITSGLKAEQRRMRRERERKNDYYKWKWFVAVWRNKDVWIWHAMYSVLKSPHEWN